MRNVAIVSHAPRRKVKANTRRHRHAARLRVQREAKLDRKAEYRTQKRRENREYRARAVFEGVNPERTLALIGEEN